jgi:hypothetical protein
LSKELKNNNTPPHWRDFKLKIIYVYEKLFQNDKEKLIYYFADQSTSFNRNSRKKTIENWLTGRTKKPKGFHIPKFKISEYKYQDNQPLFTNDSFKLWSIETFRQKVDIYIDKQESKKRTPNRLKFIYYFNLNIREIDYYEIQYSNPEELSNIEISSPRLREDMTYKGEIFEYQNMLYIFVKNHYDHMIYLVENSANIFQNSRKVYGVGQCKDFATRQPKAYMSLFSSSKLTDEEKSKYQHKLNSSNLMIAQNFPRHCILAEDFMLNNFYEKIQTIGQDLFPHYEPTTMLNRNYNDVLLQEFKILLNVLIKASQDFDFWINSRRKLQIYSLLSISKNSEFNAGIIIVYTLNQATLPFFFKMLCNQYESIYLNSVDLRYVIIIEDNRVLTSKVISKLKKLEDKDVNVKLLSENRSVYSEILLTINTNFALYRIGNEVEDNTYVTKNIDKIDELYEIHTMLEKTALPLQKFLDKQCSLNGKWFSYSYGSKADSSYFHTVPIDIKNSEVTALYITGISKGKIEKTSEQTLIILNNTIIKISNQNMNEEIFKISIIGKELYIDNRDLLVYGIMSREALSEDDVHFLLDAIHVKDNQNFRLKTSDGFDTKLAKFKAERYIYKQK